MIKFPDGYTIPEDEDEHGHEHEHDDEYEGGDGDGDKDRHEAPQKRHARRVLCEDDDEGEGEGEYEVVFYVSPASRIHSCAEAISIVATGYRARPKHLPSVSAVAHLGTPRFHTPYAASDAGAQ